MEDILRWFSNYGYWIAFSLSIVSAFSALGTGLSKQHFSAISEARLKKLQTPRNEILASHELAVTEALNSFGGTKFDSAFDLSNKEQHMFWQVLQPLLARAGWTNIPWNGGATVPLWVFNSAAPISSILPRSGSAAATNVEIHVFPEHRESLEPAAIALVSVLDKIGITATLASTPIVSVDKDAIHIWIGEKQ